MSEINLRTYREAAGEKNCSSQTLRDAVAAGKLSQVTFVGVQCIVTDERYKNWKVKEWGGRLAKKNRELRHGRNRI